jgi:hypothetical protein
MTGEDQAPSDTPCKWCGMPNQKCDYEEYAAPCMSGQISRGELVRVAADGDAQRLPDLERRLLVGLILTELAREGCDADPSYMALLAKLNGVDTEVWIDKKSWLPAVMPRGVQDV